MVKFKYFKTLAVYNNNASTIANDDIVFIEDDNSLVTHGKTYRFADLESENDGYEYVDLGLPSGTLWAKYNVGASSETEYGNCYQYGKGAAQYAETVGQSDYSGTEDPLDSSVDTAAQVWGGSWHMPTRAQIQELIDNTTYQWVTNYKGSGINGGTFTATNGAVLFLPAAGLLHSDSQNFVGLHGLYWGSSPYDSNNAYYLRFYNGSEGVYNHNRNYGFSVRPVKDYNYEFTAQLKTKVDNIQNLVVSDTTSGNITLSPNVFYSLGTLTGSLSVTLGTPVDDMPSIYSMEFDVTNTSYVPSFPSDIKWSSDVTWEANKHYEVNIRYDVNTQKYYGIIVAFDKAT